MNWPFFREPLSLPLTPDGIRFTSGGRLGRSYHLRWLLPKVLGSSHRRWLWVTRASIFLLALMAWIYTGSPWMAAGLFLPGMHFLWRCPVLVDAPSMACSLAAALILPHSWPAAIVLAVLAGCIRESGGIWAAIFAWNPILLVGVIPVAIRYIFFPMGQDPDPHFQWILDHPLRAGYEAHKGAWLDAGTMLIPWSGMVIGLAAFGRWDRTSYILATALAFAYGQLLVSMDTVRIYQQAWPAVALAVAHVAPGWSLPLVAVSVIFRLWI